MIQVKFSRKGQNDTTPSVSVHELRKAGLLDSKTTTNVGEKFELLLINRNGIPVSTTFRVNRENGSTMKAEGWNDYLLEEPMVSEPVMIGVAALKKVKRWIGK